MEENEEVVNQLVAITNCARPAARQCLEACGWSLEDAIDLYFASASADLDEARSLVSLLNSNASLSKKKNFSWHLARRLRFGSPGLSLVHSAQPRPAESLALALASRHLPRALARSWRAQLCAA